jgi:hypothetical protein
MTIRAEPFTPLPIEKFSKLVDTLVAHDPWFDDVIDTPELRRQAVIAYLADGFNHGKLWECWRDNDLCGILLLNELVPFRDGRCHFVFTDSQLADKYQLCWNLMRYSFEQVPVEVLRAEIPTYARALLKFARKLGFRFESEHRPFSWPSNAAPLDADVAKLGSRKHRATLYKGQWHDVMLLSITREEFLALEQHGRSQSLPTRQQSDGAPAVAHGS